MQQYIILSGKSVLCNDGIFRKIDGNQGAVNILREQDLDKKELPRGWVALDVSGRV